MNTILIIEDEENVNRGITFSLQKEGYQVFSSFTLKEAELLFRTHQPQLIICDINLPDGNGLDFVRRIRNGSNTHIILLTALDQEMEQVMGYEAGADDYVTKPFILSVLLLKVSAFFKKIDKEVSDVYQSGEIRFNIKEMCIWKEDDEISLTKNEWKMLQVFLEHPKQILSKNQLLQKIFDVEGDFVEENTIAVNIRRLREKIEMDASKPEFIKNIRGLGYVWDKECRKL